jgi:hypothetical protein
VSGPRGVLPASRDTPFILQTEEAEARTARSQQPEGGQSSAAVNQPEPPSSDVVQSPGPLPSMPAQAPPIYQPAPLPGPPPASGIQQVSEVRTQQMYNTVAVRAWVCGRPIFDDEVRGALPPFERIRIAQLPPEQRGPELGRVIGMITANLIDQELLVDEMMRNLEKQPKLWEKFKSMAARETDKKVNALLRAYKLNTIQELEKVQVSLGSSLESFKRLAEREFLSNVWLQHCIEPYMGKVNSQEIREYYDLHVNEFQQPDRIKWQSIFIAVGPKHPTLAEARSFADQLLAKWQSGTDIAALVEFDEGQARAHKGDGVGELRGDVRPRELETYLFSMKDGEFGEPFEIATGVHLYHLVHRQYGGVLPFDGKMQKTIENKLRGEIFEKERKRVVNEMRDKAGDRVVIMPWQLPGQPNNK